MSKTEQKWKEKECIVSREKNLTDAEKTWKWFKKADLKI